MPNYQYGANAAEGGSAETMGRRYSRRMNPGGSGLYGQGNAGGEQGSDVSSDNDFTLDEESDGEMVPIDLSTPRQGIHTAAASPANSVSPSTPFGNLGKKKKKKKGVLERVTSNKAPKILLDDNDNEVEKKAKCHPCKIFLGILLLLLIAAAVATGIILARKEWGSSSQGKNSSLRGAPEGDAVCSVLPLTVFNAGDPSDDLALMFATYGFGETQRCCEAMECTYGILEAMDCDGVREHAVQCCTSEPTPDSLEELCTGAFFSSEGQDVELEVEVGPDASMDMCTPAGRRVIAQCAVPDPDSARGGSFLRQRDEEEVEKEDEEGRDLPYPEEEGREMPYPEEATVKSAWDAQPLIDASTWPKPQEVPKGELVWEETFDSMESLEAKWFLIYDNAYEEDELQAFMPPNCQVADGYLNILAFPSEDPEFTLGAEYTSCKITTRPEFEITRGRIEIRAMMPGEPGSRASILMAPVWNKYGPGSLSGELAILETLNDSEELQGTIIIGEDPLTRGCKLWSGIEYSKGFHDYAFEWSPLRLTWYLDGMKWCSVEQWPIEDNNPLAPWDVTRTLSLGLAVGGDAADAFEDADMPWNMMIDRVAVYELTEEQFEYEPLFPGEVTPLEEGSDMQMASQAGVASPYLVSVDGEAMAWPLPSRLNAWQFDNGGNGVGYGETDGEEAFNSGNFSGRENWGVDVTERNEFLSEGLEETARAFGPVVLLEAGEWLQWTVFNPEGGNVVGGMSHYLELMMASELDEVHFKLILDSNDCEEEDAVVLLEEDGDGTGGDDIFVFFEVSLPTKQTKSQCSSLL
ncbi:unnamed protein product [Chrysoparadoxa australica]